MKLNGLKNKVSRTAVAFLLTATMVTGFAFAQGPGFGRGHGKGCGFGDGFGMGPGLLRGMMAAALNLTDAQKEQIQKIMKDTRTKNEAILEQMESIREQELAAIKAGKSEAELQSLANSGAPLRTQLHLSHLVAQSKIYQVLTPEQRAKLEELRNQAKDRIQNFRQRRNQ
jgi:Spy/CpxP family protein refolding chaperone